MKRLKETIIIVAMISGVVGIIYGIGYLKYKIWRAEHPNAETWTFYIPSKR